MIAYAVPGDLAAAPWSLTLEGTPAVTIIGYASRLIRRATQTAIYDADTDGTPLDATLKAAMRDATCAQVAVWSALAINPALGAAEGARVASAKSLGGASIQYSNYAATVDARARAATRLSEDAMMILGDAGLLGGEPLVLG